MNIICRPRQSGKTTELVDLAKKDPSYLFIVYSEALKEYVCRMGLDPKRVYTFSQAIAQDLLTGRRGNIYIDNAEYFLQRLFQSNPLQAVVMDAPF